MTTCSPLRFWAVLILVGAGLIALSSHASAAPLPHFPIAMILAGATELNDGDKDDDDDSTHCMISSLGIFAVLGCGLRLTSRSAKAATPQPDQVRPDRV